MDYKRYPNRSWRHFFSTPFIYFQIIPLIFIDFCVEIYHHICFPLYGLPLIKRNQYIRIDRHKLQYLSLFDKVNCAYCGYANGLVRYLTAIAAATEKYWCGIKHQSGGDFINQEHQKNFLDYGNEEQYQKFMNNK